MLRGPRHLLIAVWLAAHGAVAASGPGAHLLVAGLLSDGATGDPSVRAAHPCPICEWSNLGGLPADAPLAASAPIPTRPVAIARPLAVAGRPLGPARPRAPPRSA